MIKFEGKKFLNEQEAYLYCLEQIKIIKQSLGNALPDPIQGPQGDTGADGARGPQGPRGTGLFGCTTVLPSATAYQEGDMYLLFNGQLYKKVNGSWVMQTTLKGPQGPIGLSGGTEVIANPAEAATDELNKVSIDGTTYNIKDFTVSEVNSLKNIASSSFRYDTVNQQYIFDDVPVEFTYPVFFQNDLVIDDIDNIVDTDYNPLIVCENLKDANGNKRFIEGDITPVSMTGVTYSYKKWSLSGTHLMIVACGTIASGNKFVGGGDLFKVTLPSWILSKIQPTLNNLISYGSILAVDGSYYTTQVSIYFDKKTDHILCGVSAESPVFENDNNFRIVFDLLIDMA